MRKQPIENTGKIRWTNISAFPQWMKMGPQEDYIETVFTCEGDFDDPKLHDRLVEFRQSLNDLLHIDKKKQNVILKKVEPWNSVRVTFNIPRGAALRLKQLAQQGDETLRRLGVLAVQIEGDQLISLTIAGKNNERTELVFRTSGNFVDDAINSSLPSAVPTEHNHVVQASPEKSLRIHSPTSVDLAHKNIVDYLRQGAPMFLSQIAEKDGTVFSPSLPAAKDAISSSTNPISLHIPTAGPADTSTSAPSALSNFGPVGNPTSMSMLPILDNIPQRPNIKISPESLAPKYPSHLLPSSPLTQHVGGTQNFIFPPPPPYPHSSIAAAINNIQKLPKNVTSASPLLVNLLQTDPAMAMMNNALLSKMIPPLDEKPIKKKRKRKSKEGKNSSNDPTALCTSADSSPVLGIGAESVATTSVSSLPGHVGLPSADIKVHGKFHHHMHLSSDHNVSVYASGAPAMSHPLWHEPTSGKLINPYTGDLEPADTVVAGNNLFKDSLGNVTHGTGYLPIEASPHTTAGGLTHSLNSRQSQSQSTSPSPVAAPMRPMSNPGSAAAYLPLSVATTCTSQMGLPISSPFPPSSLSICDTLSKGSLTGLYRMATPLSAAGPPAHFVHHQRQPAIHAQPLQAMQHVAQNVGLAVMSLASHTNHSSHHQQPHPLHHIHQQQSGKSTTPPASQKPSMSDAIRFSGGGNALPGLALVEDLLAVAGGHNSRSVKFPTSSPVLSHHHDGAMSASEYHENRTLHTNKDNAQTSLLGRSEPMLWRTGSCNSHIVGPVPLPVRCASTKSNIQHGAAVCGHNSGVVPRTALESKQELDKNSVQKHLRNLEPPNVLTASDRRLALSGKPSPPTSGGSLSDDVCSANHDSGVSSQSETASDTQFNEDTLSFSDAQPSSPSLPQDSNKGSLSSSLSSVNHPPPSSHSAQRSATVCVVSAVSHQNNPDSINHTPVLQRTKTCSADAADRNSTSQHVQVTSTLNMHSAANNPQISIMQSSNGQLLNVGGDSDTLTVGSRSDIFNPVTVLHWNTKSKTSDFHTAKTTKVLSEDLVQRLALSHTSVPQQQLDSCKIALSKSGDDPSSRLSLGIPQLVEKRLSPLLATSRASLSPVHDGHVILSKSTPHSKRVSPHHTSAILEQHCKDSVSTQAGLGNDTSVHTHKQSVWHSPKHQYHSSNNPIHASVTSTVISGGHPVMSSSYPALSVNHMASSLNHIQASGHAIVGSLHPDLRGYHAAEDKLEFGGTLHNSHSDSYQGGSTAVVGAVNQSHELMHHINHILKTKPLAKNILLDGLHVDKEKAFIDSLIDRRLELLSARSVSNVDSGNRHSVTQTSVHSAVASIASHMPNNHNLSTTFVSTSASRSLANVNFSEGERLEQNNTLGDNIGASDLHHTDSLDFFSAKDNNGKVSDLDIKTLDNGSYDKMDLSSLVVDKLVSSISACSYGKQSHQNMPLHSTPSGSPEQASGKVGNITNMYMRKSPTSGLATLKALAPVFSSDLPLPKRLTESVQKLVKPLPSGEGSDTGGIQQAIRKPPSSKQIPLSSSPPHMSTNHGHSNSSSKSPVSDHCLLRVSSHPSLHSHGPQTMVTSHMDGHANILQQTHTGTHLPYAAVGKTSGSPSTCTTTTTTSLVKSSYSKSPNVSQDCANYSKCSNRTELIDGLIHSRTLSSAVNVSNVGGLHDVHKSSRLSPSSNTDRVNSKAESLSESQLACDVKPIQSGPEDVCTIGVLTDNSACTAILPQTEIQLNSNIILNKDAELLHAIVKSAEQHSEKLSRVDSGYIECLPDCSSSRKEDDVCQPNDQLLPSEATNMCVEETNTCSSSVVISSKYHRSSTEEQCHPCSSEPCQQHSDTNSESLLLLEKQFSDKTSEIKIEDLNSGYNAAVSLSEQANSNSSASVSSNPILRIDSSNVHPESLSIQQADSKPPIQHKTILNDTNSLAHIDSTESILGSHEKITSNCDTHSIIVNENTTESSNIHMIATQDGSFIVSGRGPGRRPRVSKKILRSLDKPESPMETRTLRGGKTFNRDGALAIRVPKAAKRKAILEGILTDLSPIHADEKLTRVFRNRGKMSEELQAADLPSKRTRLDSTTSVSHLGVSEVLSPDEDSKDTNCESVSDITVLSNESILVNKAMDDTMPRSNDSSATLIGDPVLCTDTDSVNCFNADNSVSTKPTIETLLDSDAIHKIEGNMRDKDADIANWKTLNFGFDLDLATDELDNEASMHRASQQNRQCGISPAIITEERSPSHINKVIAAEEVGTTDQQFKRTTRSGARPRSTELTEASSLPAAAAAAATSPVPPKRRRLSRDRPS